MTLPAPSPQQRLLQPLAQLQRFHPAVLELLSRVGLRTAADALFNFPRDYLDLSEIRPIARLEEGMLTGVIGTVEEIEQRTTRSGKVITGVLLRDENAYLRGIWYNQPFMRQHFQAGQRVLFSGKVRRDDTDWTIAHPKVRFLQPGEMPRGQIQPVYRLCDGLKQSDVRKAVKAALALADCLEEVFPDNLLVRYRLCPLPSAVRQIHFPANQDELARARRRFVFQELLVLQLALALKRAAHQEAIAAAMEATTVIDSRIRRLFPFELTTGQKQAISEIAADMARPRPMNRLLQGDVGCGKTAVAAYAILLAVAHGYQAALMAPTEILARQHVLTLRQWLRGSQVRLLELMGGMTPGQRQQALAAIAAGTADVVIGTHALIQEDVAFCRLGLVVIDEQHKFGVRQRAQLRQAGLSPHYLVMTATPIPRSITMTLFGDLDVSFIRDLPPGRQAVRTYLVSEEQRSRWWEFFRRKLREGQQGYVIAPLVEEHETLASAEEQFEVLSNGELASFTLGLVHGQMSGAEKDAAMERFRRGETQVLVATTVIEVGVDVPKATLMTIDGGERFGLSQLHQLRGRVSRGSEPGYCGVFCRSASEQSRERLQALVRFTDGFELAEVDFAMRGPGDLLGTRQHGLAALRIADLRRDAETLFEARKEAFELVAADPLLQAPALAKLKAQVLRRYGQTLSLGDVG